MSSCCARHMRLADMSSCSSGTATRYLQNEIRKVKLTSHSVNKSIAFQGYVRPTQNPPTRKTSTLTDLTTRQS